MDNFKVSLAKYLCPICGGVAEEVIVTNTRLTKAAASKVEKLNGKTIGFSDHACKKCSEYKDTAVFFIGINPKKSSDKEPYRTGQIVGIKDDAPLVLHCKKYIRSLKDGTRFCFIDELVGKEIGLWDLQHRAL